MSPTPRDSGSRFLSFPITPWLVAAALLISPLSARAQRERGVDWHARQFSDTTADGTIRIQRIPDYFWDYLEHGKKVDGSRWESLELKKQLTLLEGDRQSKESTTMFNMYDAARKDLLQTIQKVKATEDPTERREAVAEAEARDNAGIQSVVSKLGPKYGDELVKLRKQLRDLREASALKKSDSRTQKMQESGSLGIGKEVQNPAYSKGVSSKLNAHYDGQKAGKDEGAGKEKNFQKIESDKLAGGQLRDNAERSASSTFGKADKEPPPLQTSLFAMKTAPDGIKQSGTFSSSFAPLTVSKADRDMLSNDMAQLRDTPTGKQLLDGGNGRKGVADAAPELLPDFKHPEKQSLSDKIGNALSSHATTADKLTGYDNAEHPGSVYFPGTDLPGAAGGTFYDPKTNKTFIALSPSLKNSDEGVRLAVETEELTHGMQKQGMVNSGKPALESSTELEKSARLKALQVYHEYYYEKHPEKTPPTNTELEKELYNQHSQMMTYRKGLLNDLDKQYAANPDSDNTQSIDNIIIRRKIDAGTDNMSKLAKDKDYMSAVNTRVEYIKSLQENKAWFQERNPSRDLESW